MFTPKDKKAITIDTSSRCTLECAECWRQKNRNKGLNPSLNGRDVSIEDIKKLLPYYDHFLFCGQFSDPIFNKDIIPILELLYAYNKEVNFNTAATSRKHNKEWYEAAFKAHPKAKWTFGIDGLPKDSEWYRVNQDGEFLFEMMILAAESGINTFWQYIVFSYNEDTIEEAMAIASKHNIKFVKYLTTAFPNKAFMPKKEENKTWA